MTEPSVAKLPAGATVRPVRLQRSILWIHETIHRFSLLSLAFHPPHSAPTPTPLEEDRRFNHRLPKV
jgi:hypothetical protein